MKRYAKNFLVPEYVINPIGRTDYFYVCCCFIILSQYVYPLTNYKTHKDLIIVLIKFLEILGSELVF
jgi:hypothetical protein